MDQQELIHRMRKELVILKGSMVLLTALSAIFWFGAFTQKSGKQHFGEIDVERVNIVDSAGGYCFVLTNGSRAPGAIMGGKERKRSNSNSIPSILFYNEEGDESGALLTAGRRQNDSDYYGSSRLVFDRFKHDETLAFQYYEDRLGGYAGMLVQDTREMPILEWVEGNAAIRAMPDGPEKNEALKKYRASAGPWATKRLFVGKNDRTKSAVVDLADRKGNSRLRLSVDSLGMPRLDFLNENGEITFSLPDSAHSARIK